MYWSNLSESSASSGCSPYPVENAWSYGEKKFYVLYKVLHCGLKCMILRLNWRNLCKELRFYSVFLWISWMSRNHYYLCDFLIIIFHISCYLEGLDFKVRKPLFFVCFLIFHITCTCFSWLWILKSGNHYFFVISYRCISCFLYILNIFGFLDDKCL